MMDEIESHISSSVLSSFLDKKPFFYDEIDYTRMPRVYEKIKTQLKIPKIIHLIGTNGKGTTGRFLASALHQLGYKIGHYTSPHIIEFNERIWLNGSNVKQNLLEEVHLGLLKLLSQEDADALSYFEYTTFLAMYLYQNCDYVVLEAGLGGEHDATAVFPKLLTLVTPIDKDHEAFLGNTIESIARTKLNAVQNVAILGKQNYKEVGEIAGELSHSRGIQVYRFIELLQEDDKQKILQITKDLSLANYLVDNLFLAISTLKYLGIVYKTSSFIESKLFGRLTRFKSNILLDVGHNTLAAQKIKESLAGEKYILVYNSYKDKNYKEILRILKPIILEVAIINVNETRIEKQELLEEVLKNLEIKYKQFEKIEKEEQYLVFGSFSVVESFLKGYSG